MRVTPELDLPGHSHGLARGAPQVYIQCAGTGTFLPDPTTDAFFRFLDEIVAELVGLFPDSYFHMGGDEVNMGCWANNSKVAAWMKRQGYTTTMEALGYFQSRVQSILQKHKRIVLFWDEFWEAGLPALNSTVAEIRSNSFQSTLASGRPALTTGIQEAWCVKQVITIILLSLHVFKNNKRKTRGHCWAAPPHPQGRAGRGQGTLSASSPGCTLPLDSY